MFAREACSFFVHFATGTHRTGEQSTTLASQMLACPNCGEKTCPACAVYGKRRFSAQDIIRQLDQTHQPASDANSGVGC
ncbi:unnamed protein product [Pleuronectes platessa]|uniref:Uncharacterized protein n=1 Tax=Pleuronectes platessa TaxID=8262 RepID=A0A9N7UYG6_PLEPL|nr:unnamed protein product [Pleuronectes platessa]